MKKVLFVVLMALIGLNANAQKGTKAIGVNLGYGTDVKTMSLGVKGLYGVTNNIEGEASFTYFMKKDGFSMWNISVDAHYLFPIQDKLTVYPLAGLSFIHAGTSYELDTDFGPYSEGIEVGSSVNKLGFDLGAGVRYDLTSNISLNAELKYQFVSLYDQLLLSVGVAYKF